ncbi:hypothetical protein DJ72_03845 [Halorubrum distributum]|nr:hypothetical protein DJ72_03845 [Halorubrum distributum]
MEVAVALLALVALGVAAATLNTAVDTGSGGFGGGGGDAPSVGSDTGDPGVLSPSGEAGEFSASGLCFPFLREPPAVLALLAGVLGGDLAVLRSLSAGASPSGIAESIAFTPNGAFRGLVFEHVIGVAFAPEGGFVDTGRAVASLVGWSVLGVVAAVAAVAFESRVDVAVERLRGRLGR